MASMTEITYAEFAQAVAQARLGTEPSELHGSVAGYLCGGGTGQVHELLTALQLESDDAGVVDPLHTLLGQLAAGMSSDLRSGKSVAPLLPPSPLAARADGMVDWCRGFLGGLGLTGALAGRGLEPDARELLDDFGHIASMRIECEEGDEAGLADVLEFICGGTRHLHAALARAGQR